MSTQSLCPHGYAEDLSRDFALSLRGKKLVRIRGRYWATGMSTGW